MPLHLAILLLNLVLATAMAGGVLAMPPRPALPYSMRRLLAAMALIDLVAALLSVFMLDVTLPLTNLRLWREGILPIIFNAMGCCVVWTASAHAHRQE